jgi:hypothetical protein
MKQSQYLRSIVKWPYWARIEDADRETALKGGEQRISRVPALLLNSQDAVQMGNGTERERWLIAKLKQGLIKGQQWSSFMHI